MFTIELREGVYATKAMLSAKAETLDLALNFVRNFAFRGMTIESPWQERSGGYVMDVYDWCDCWSFDPPPLARITAPPGFIPFPSR